MTSAGQLTLKFAVKLWPASAFGALSFIYEAYLNLQSLV